MPRLGRPLTLRQASPTVSELSQAQHGFHKRRRSRKEPNPHQVVLGEAHPGQVDFATTRVVSAARPSGQCRIDCLARWHDRIVTPGTIKALQPLHRQRAQRVCRTWADGLTDQPDLVNGA